MYKYKFKNENDGKKCHKHSTHDKCLSDSINNTVLTEKSKIP